jgi:hypothetical protein
MALITKDNSSKKEMDGISALKDVLENQQRKDKALRDNESKRKH